MRQIESLKRLRALFHRDGTDDAADLLSGPGLLEQEPDLVQETARYNVSASAWAAGGHPTE